MLLRDIPCVVRSKLADFEEVQTLRTATIEKGISIATPEQTTSFGNAISLSETMKKLEVGDGGFRIDESKWRGRVTATASYLGIRVRTTKLPDGRLWVTRVE